MELIKSFLDFFLHLDDHLRQIILDYQGWTYLILFLIIFIETGLVIWPFLPGDSLLFAAGTFAATGELNLAALLILLFVAAVAGDTVNYYIGKYFGDKMLGFKFRGKNIVKEQHMEKTHNFYEKHGTKTIILARFVPIVRTFAPFVAGIGKMNYSKFITYNIVGGFIWVFSLTLLGYFFGNIPIVAKNFEIVVLGIIGISVLPIFFEFAKEWLKKKQA